MQLASLIVGLPQVYPAVNSLAFLMVQAVSHQVCLCKHNAPEI